MAKHDPDSQRGITAVMGLVGLFLMLIACNVIPSPAKKFNVPRWVLFICGLIFALPGLARLLIPRHPRTARYLMSAMLLCFGIVGVATGLTGNEEGFSGGLPLVSKAANVKIARVVFAGGGLACVALAVACARGYGEILSEKNEENDE